MNCPNCKRVLPDNISLRINFCPLCGKKLFEDGKDYLNDGISRREAAI